MPDRLAVSVLLLTLNEESNLPRCLAALGWCDDVVVLDSLSVDRTRQIAEAAGARVVERPFDDFATQRNFGLETIEFRHEWILHLDADEIVTPELVEAIAEVTLHSTLDAFRIPSKLMFRGRWLRRSGMYPTYQVRLTRRGAFRFRQVGHGQKEGVPSERVGTINEAYLHFAFSRGLHEWFDKHNRYSSAEASEPCAMFKWSGLFSNDRYSRRQALRSVARRMPLRPMLRFIYMYVLKGGFLEGRAGLMYCLLLATYEFMITAKEAELKYGHPDIEALNDRAAAMDRVPLD